jgi:hypothetical protein
MSEGFNFKNYNTKKLKIIRQFSIKQASEDKRMPTPEISCTLNISQTMDSVQYTSGAIFYTSRAE